MACRWRAVRRLGPRVPPRRAARGLAAEHAGRPAAARRCAPVLDLVDRVAAPRVMSFATHLGGRGQAVTATDPAAGTTVEPLTARHVVEHGPELASRARMRVAYDEPFLEWLVGEMQAVTGRGELVRRLVRGPDGRVLGWHVSFLHRTRVSRVLQVVARDGATGVVLDHLFDEAARCGTPAVRGRLSPGCCPRCGSARACSCARRATSPTRATRGCWGRSASGRRCSHRWTGRPGGSPPEPGPGRGPRMTLAGINGKNGAPRIVKDPPLPAEPVATPVAEWGRLLGGADSRTLEILERRRVAAKRRGWLVSRMLVIADVMGLGLAFVLSRLLWSGPPAEPGAVTGTAELLVFALTLPIWVAAAKVIGLYDNDDERADHSTADDLIGVFHLITVGTWLLYVASQAFGFIQPELAPKRPLLVPRDHADLAAAGSAPGRRAGGASITCRTRSSSARATSASSSPASSCTTASTARASSVSVRRGPTRPRARSAGHAHPGDRGGPIGARAPVRRRARDLRGSPTRASRRPCGWRRRSSSSTSRSTSSRGSTSCSAPGGHPHDRGTPDDGPAAGSGPPTLRSQARL